MEDDIIDIIHRIDFEVEDSGLNKLTGQLRTQASEIGKLAQRQADYARTLKKMSLDETQGRKMILDQMSKTKVALDKEKKALEGVVLNNQKFNSELVKEQGLIGAVTTKLKILEDARKRATSTTDLQRYNRLVQTEQAKLKSYNAPEQNGGIMGLLRGSNNITGQIGAVSRLVPAIGGALSLASLGSQMVDVTKKFESYITTLKSAYGSSIKAEGAFNKIQQFAAKTPFSVDELTGSFIKLKNRGFDPTTKELTNLGDLASSQGKSFDQLTEALLDAQTGEFERLKEFGIKAKTVGDTVTLSFKGVEKQVKKTDQEGLRNAIISLGELNGVAGQMAAQSQTLNGKLSNLGDTTDMLLYNFSKKLGVDSFLGGLADMANDALSALDDLLDNSKELAIQSRADATAAKTLADEYDNLAGKTKLTADEKGRLTIIQGELVSILGESILVLNKETGAYELNMKAVRNLIREKLILANSKAVEVLTKYNEGSANRDQNIAKAKTYSAELRALAKQDANAYRAALEASELFQKNPEQFDFYYNRLDKTAKRIFDLRGDLRKANGETNKLNKNLNAIAGDYSDVTGGGAISSYFTGQLDLGDPEVKTPVKPAVEKKKKEKKGKTPQEIALENIANAEKLAQAAEEKRNAEFLKRQNVSYQKEEISKAVFDNRIERNEETHQKTLLEINIKYSRQRSKFQKSGDSAQSEAGAQSSEAKLKEIITKAKEKAESEIKAAIDTFNIFNNELFDLQNESDAKDIQRLKDQHQKKMDLIDENIKEETEKYKVAVDQQNLERQAVVLGGINILNQKKKAQEVQNTKEEVKLIESQFEKKVNAELELQKDSLAIYTDQERLNFVGKYLFKEGQNKAELDQLRAVGDDKQKIEEKTQLALLYLNYNAANKILGGLVARGDATEAELKKQQALVDGIAKEIAKNSEGSSDKDKDWRKSWKDAGVADYAELASAAAGSAATIVASFEQQADREIEIRERRVSRAAEIADRGNAEALQIEEKRLENAQKQKEKYAKQQMGINAIQQISNMTLAISQAAAQGGGILSLPAILAMVAALGTGFAMVSQLSQDSTPAFKDGVINFQGKGTGTSDSNIVKISHGESVINAEATARNAEILRMINNGSEILPINYNIANGIKPGGQNQVFKLESLEKGLQEVKDAIISKPNQSVEIDRNGIAVITEEVRVINRKRWNA